jgi:hypothetical protein
MGSIFLRDEKQLLKEKREKEISEMKRMLAEQVEEKKKRQIEEKRRLEEYESKLEASIKKVNIIQDSPKPTEIIKEDSVPQINIKEEKYKKEVSELEELKSQIQVLNKQNEELLRKLETREEQLTRYIPRKSVNKVAASSDVHKSKETRIKQEQLGQPVILIHNI